MDIQTEKLELVRRLLDIDNEVLLQELKDVFDKQEKDFWLDLPEDVKSGITRSKMQADAGLLTQHDEVMKKYSRYL